MLDASADHQIEDLVHRGRLDELRRHLLEAFGPGARIDQPLADRRAGGGVVHDGQVHAGGDVRPRAVLDEHARAVGPHERDLPRLMALGDEPAPGGRDVESGSDEVVDSFPDQVPGTDAQQRACRGVRVDVATFVVDDHDTFEELVEGEASPGSTR